MRGKWKANSRHDSNLSSWLAWAASALQLSCMLLVLNFHISSDVRPSVGTTWTTVWGPTCLSGFHPRQLPAHVSSLQREGTRHVCLSARVATKLPLHLALFYIVSFCVLTSGSSVPESSVVAGVRCQVWRHWGMSPLMSPGCCCLGFVCKHRKKTRLGGFGVTWVTQRVDMCKHMGLLEAFLVMFHPKLDI